MIRRCIAGISSLREDILGSSTGQKYDIHCLLNKRPWLRSIHFPAFSFVAIPSIQRNAQFCAAAHRLFPGRASWTTIPETTRQAGMLTGQAKQVRSKKEIGQVAFVFPISNLTVVEGATD